MFNYVFFQWVLEYSSVREYEYSLLSSTTDDLNKNEIAVLNCQCHGVSGIWQHDK